MTARVRLWTLVREELRSLPRNLFGLGAVAIVLGIFAPMGAFLYGGEGGLDDTLIFTWLVGVLVVAILVGTRVAAARRSRFVDSLYTTPLEQRTWILAQVAVGAVLALLFLAVQIPFLLVQIAYLGVPDVLPVFLLAAVLMGAFSVALGVFCGVVVGENGPGAAGGLAGGLAFISFVMLIVHGAVQSGPPTTAQAVMLRLTSLSPLVLVMDGAGVNPFGVRAAEAWRPFLGLAVLIVGLFGAAWVAYTRAQGPLGWESRSRAPRAAVVALVALALIVPIASAEVDFVEDDDDSGFSLDTGEHTQVALVARGAPIHESSFTLSEVYDSPDLQLGQPIELDALVLLKVTEGTVVRAVHIEVTGSHAVRVVTGGVLTVSDGRPDGRAPPGQGWQTTSDVPPRPVYRVPVTLEAIQVEALGESPSLVEIHTEFFADGKPLSSKAKITLDAEIPGAKLQLGLAGAVLPIGSAGSFVRRKLRTR